MYGIGNAYFYQKQYLKARQYFENILKVDEDSVVGYSGLLNLFIERDDLPEAVLIYVDLRDKKLLDEVPSALLAKLAGYFLDKSPSADKNVRIDYGIRSPRLKDDGDNMFPAVLQVLGALMKKDPEYPPLYLQYAKYAEKQGNLKLMENYLTSAIEHAEEAGYGYFGAYHLMAEYHYRTSQPVRAYGYLQKALKAWANPAPFTREDFYRETEHPGRTYTVMGNIFYYYFDKVKMMTGDQERIEDEEIENDPDKMANFLVARKKYEQALALGYESSELHYNLGRIYYLNRDYSAALEEWLNLYDDFSRSPELMLALGNVFYRNGNLEASKAQYRKVINLFELQAEKIRVVAPEKSSQVKIYETLTTAYNNLGVVYQKQNNEAASSVAYWKSIDYAKRIEKESELARVNLARAFKEREKQPEPIFDDNLPYSINIYREEHRQRRDDQDL